MKNKLDIFGAILLCSMSAASVAASGPFSVVTAQGHSLPTTVITEGESFAYYQVTNLTNQVLVDSFVKYLPDNVEQVTGDAAYCDATFTLQKHGSNGDDCTLKLRVFGAVDGSNLDPEDQIYVCADAYNCTRAEELLNVQVVSSLATGAYFFCNGNDCEQKLSIGERVFLSQRMGDTWSFPGLSDAYLPEDNLNLAGFFGVGCAENFCVGGGSYEVHDQFTSDPTDLIPKPLVAASPNGASAWNYDAGFSNLFDVGLLLTASCADDFCVVGGGACDEGEFCFVEERTVNDASFALGILLATNLDGYSWGVIQETPDSYDGQGQIFASGCSDNECIVGGTFSNFDASQNAPLLATSSDGINWDINLIDLNSDYSGANQSFYGVSCSESLCIAGGGAQGGGALLAVRNGNASVTWDYATDFMNEINSSKGTQIFATNCYDTLCVVTGQYGDGSALLATSTDGFATWTLINDIVNQSFDISDVSGILNGVSCFGNYCAAVGQFTPPASMTAYPFLLQSTDGGVNWSLVDHVVNFPGNVGGELLNVSCSTGICTVAGLYTVPTTHADPTDSRPLLLETTNQGATWTSINNVPNDFLAGFLLGVNSPGGGNPSLGIHTFDIGVKHPAIL